MKSDNLQPKFIQVLEITNLNIFLFCIFHVKNFNAVGTIVNIYIEIIYLGKNGQKTQFRFDVVPYLLPCLQF